MIPTTYHIVLYIVLFTAAIPSKPSQKVYADKGYAGKPNRGFLDFNKIADGIMRKDSTTAKFYPVKYVLRTFAGKHNCCYHLGQ